MKNISFYIVSYRVGISLIHSLKCCWSEDRRFVDGIKLVTRINEIVKSPNREYIERIMDEYSVLVLK